MNLPSFSKPDCSGGHRLESFECLKSSEPYVVAALYPPNRMLTTHVRKLIDHLASDQLIDATSD